MGDSEMSAAGGSSAPGGDPVDVKGKGKAPMDPVPQDMSMDEEDDDGTDEEEEEGPGEEEEEDDDNMEEITTDNIVSGRTRGKNIDFAKAAEEQPEEEDEDDDDDFEEPEDEDMAG